MVDFVWCARLRRALLEKLHWPASESGELNLLTRAEEQCIRAYRTVGRIHRIEASLKAVIRQEFLLLVHITNNEESGLPLASAVRLALP
jgi:hypothetical protein